MITKLNKYKVDKARSKKVFLGDKVLYDLCKKYFWHKKGMEDAISAKVWLIGRSYAVAIERGRNNKLKSTPKFYEEDIPVIFKNSNLDEDLKKLKSKILSVDNISDCLKIHYHLMITLENKIVLAEGSTNSSKRSFCSKYLHFHLPNLFFIYDNIANRKINEYLKWKEVSDSLKNLINRNESDNDYSKFFIKCFELKNEINNEFNWKFTPRQIDNLLYFD